MSSIFTQSFRDLPDDFDKLLQSLEDRGCEETDECEMPTRVGVVALKAIGTLALGFAAMNILFSVSVGVLLSPAISVVSKLVGSLVLAVIGFDCMVIGQNIREMTTASPRALWDALSDGAIAFSATWAGKDAEKSWASARLRRTTEGSCLAPIGVSIYNAIRRS